MQFTLSIGDSKTLAIPMDWEGAPFEPGSDWGLIFTAKLAEADLDVDAVIQKATGAGITATGSVAYVALVPDDTSSIDAGIVYCDIQAQHLTSGEIRTIRAIYLNLKRDITRGTSASIPIYTTDPAVLWGEIVSATAPLNPQEGWRWFCTIDGVRSTYYDGYWVADSGATAANGVVTNVTVNAAIETDPESSRTALGFSEIFADCVADYDTGTGAGTDNTAIINAAIVAASATGFSQTVWLPPGNIKITGEIVVANRVTLRGHGFAKTKIYAVTAGQNGIWINSPLHDNCKFFGFAIYGPAGHGGDGVATGVGILCDSKTTPGTYVFGPTEFDGLWISRWSTCLKLGQMPLTVAKQCYFGGFRLHGIHLVSTDTFQFNACAMGYGTETIDQTVAGCTTINIEGSVVDPVGTNFSGEFTNCELGDTWKFLTLSGCRVVFESCNFETRNVLTTANSLFDVSPGARLVFKNCRPGFASETIDAGSTPFAVVFADCSNNSAEPRVIFDNSAMADGLYTLAVKYVGDNWGFYNPSVIGNSLAPAKFYNASNVEQASMPTAHSLPMLRGHDWFASNVLSSAWAAARRSQLFSYFVGAGDTTPGDDNMIFARKTRKKLAGAVQFTRSSLSNDSLMEVLAANVAVTSNANSSGFALTAGYPTLGIGTFQGTGDVVVMLARGTCAANANVKTFSAWVYDSEKTATRLTITDATAVYWEAELRFHSVLASTTKMVLCLQAFDANGLKVHDKRICVDQGGFTSVDVGFYIMGQSATAADLTCFGWDAVWRSNAIKV